MTMDRRHPLIKDELHSHHAAVVWAPQDQAMERQPVVKQEIEPLQCPATPLSLTTAAPASSGYRRPPARTSASASRMQGKHHTERVMTCPITAMSPSVQPALSTRRSSRSILPPRRSARLAKPATRPTQALAIRRPPEASTETKESADTWEPAAQRLTMSGLSGKPLKLEGVSLQTAEHMKDFIDMWKKLMVQHHKGPTEMRVMRRSLHSLEHANVSGPAIDQLDLLKRLRELADTSDTQVPSDIQCDAQILLNKWSISDYSGNPVRRFPKSCNDPAVVNRSAQFFGQGHLVVGQIFANRASLHRDGGHGQTRAGISGSKSGDGAYSIVMYIDSNYDDDDLGDVLFYTGTKADKGHDAKKATQDLLNSVRTQRPVRVFRNASRGKHSAATRRRNTTYFPAMGIRYDGLYRATEAEIVDSESQHYRFTFERLEGQVPIRYEGPGLRPSVIDKKAMQAKKALS